MNNTIRHPVQGQDGWVKQEVSQHFSKLSEIQNNNKANNIVTQFMKHKDENGYRSIADKAYLVKSLVKVEDKSKIYQDSMINKNDTAKMKEHYDNESKRNKCGDFLDTNFCKKDKISNSGEKSTLVGSDATSFLNKTLKASGKEKLRAGLSKFGNLSVKKSPTCEKNTSFLGG